MRTFIRYLWGTIRRPSATFKVLATESSVRWAVVLACSFVLEVWSHMALHLALGLDYLGPRPILSEPAFVGLFGYWRIGLANWLPFFAAFMLLLGLFSLVLPSGVAQLMSKLWNGRGTFEQMVNGMAFANLVPALVIGATSEWVFSVPMNLLSGHAHWWTAAMRGEFGPAVAVLWNLYVFGIYIGFQYGWATVLSAIAIRNIQNIPMRAALLTAIVSFAVYFFTGSMFIR